jgi:hypothetical protein
VTLENNSDQVCWREIYRDFLEIFAKRKYAVALLLVFSPSCLLVKALNVTDSYNGGKKMGK